ncbi:MAG: hypothetical protein KatS3mg038_1000 [Candidatus Kapaibacterium sp.]|nr:MAG: hypothetical protein KatS3mg038_1000 [Candidatus Kapabacteria bacterium]
MEDADVCCSPISRLGARNRQGSLRGGVRIALLCLSWILPMMPRKAPVWHL